MVFILAETAAGYAIFKAKDSALKNPKTLADDLASVENATSMYDINFENVTNGSLRLKTFSKFENTADALDNISAIVEGKVSPKLASLLADLNEKSASLIVSDPKLGMNPLRANSNGRNIYQSDSQIVVRDRCRFFDR